MLIKNPIGCLFAALFLAGGLMTASAAQAAERSFPIMSSDELVRMVEEDGRGKVVIISVFASWCPPCQKEMPMLVKLREEFGENDLLLIGLSVDESVRDLSRFVETHKANFPVYLGTGELFAALGTGPIPHTYIFNRKGELVESIDGLIPEPLFRSILTPLLAESDV